MPRIRTIKPELPQSESMGAISREARLCFIQLFTLVDDDGRTRGASRLLASLLYPYDQDAGELIDGWLAELERVGCARRYEVDGTVYLEIIKFSVHQKIDRPTPSRLPAFREGSRGLARARSLSSTKEGIKDQDQVSKNPPPAEEARPPEIAKDREEAKRPRDEAKKPRDTSRATRIPADWQPTAEEVEYAKKEGLNDDQVRRATERFRNHWTAKSGKDATKTSWGATWRNWVLSDSEKLGLKPAPVNGAVAPASTKPKHLDKLPDGKIFLQADTPEWDQWSAYYREHGGPNGVRAAPPRFFHGGWHFPSRWPPGYEESLRAAEAEMLKDPTS